MKLNKTKLFSNREESIPMYPQNAKIAEIGTWGGYWAAKMMRNTNPEELHIFDRDFSRFEHHFFNKDELNKITFHEGDSYEMMMKQPDSYYDAIYIDGDRSLEGVSREILASSTKIRENGLLVFNDYIATARAV